ncbi:MAG TPA: 3-deoxy-D-arabino-heptulosonate 7-phosphate synthase [Burkholderiaceae bacterium]|nr:3-deoxy-D-arabino-heptulosonate 7-phosphate synthase [Burkholderiaceae bacterium]
MNTQRDSLDAILRGLPRRFCLPDLAATEINLDTLSSSAALGVLIEQVRQTPAAGGASSRHQLPTNVLRSRFIDTLARLIGEVMDPHGGDPAFKAMVLRHRWPQVDEYARLSAHAKQDARTVRALVNAIAHPAKQARMSSGWLRTAMGRLHEASAGLQASEGASLAAQPDTPIVASWQLLADVVDALLNTLDVEQHPAFEEGLQALAQSDALASLQRLQKLASVPQVQQYLEFCHQQGPRQGSVAAAKAGRQSRQRGERVEQRAYDAIQALAQRLNDGFADAPRRSKVTASGRLGATVSTETGNARSGRWKVVTALHVPADLSKGSRYAKTEWDVVLLRKSLRAGATTVWDIALLVEAKASPDAATTDFPRLLRGLSVLNSADPTHNYSFQSAQGGVYISGLSLSGLPSNAHCLRDHVLYCCHVDNDNQRANKIASLDPANTMRLLSRPACLEYAAQRLEGHCPDQSTLAPVWDELLHTPSLRPVLDHYAMASRARALIVSADDIHRYLNSEAPGKDNG